MGIGIFTFEGAEYQALGIFSVGKVTTNEDSLVILDGPPKNWTIDRQMWAGFEIHSVVKIPPVQVVEPTAPGALRFFEDTRSSIRWFNTTNYRRDIEQAIRITTDAMKFGFERLQSEAEMKRCNFVIAWGKALEDAYKLLGNDLLAHMRGLRKEAEKETVPAD